VKLVSYDDDSLFQSPAVLFENVSPYSVLSYPIAEAETLLYCAEYNH
jgi:hypothetical protein